MCSRYCRDVLYIKYYLPQLIIIQIVLGLTQIVLLLALIVSQKQLNRYQHKMYILSMETHHGLTTFHHHQMPQLSSRDSAMQNSVPSSVVLLRSNNFNGLRRVLGCLKLLIRGLSFLVTLMCYRK